MSTKNTIEDIRFAEQYVEYLSRHGKTAMVRARAKVLLATIAILRASNVTWREDLLAELDRQNVSREVEDLFPLPDTDTDSLFGAFIENVTNPKGTKE